jgi:hypothetical protein
MLIYYTIYIVADTAFKCLCMLIFPILFICLESNCFSTLDTYDASRYGGVNILVAMYVVDCIFDR